MEISIDEEIIEKLHNFKKIFDDIMEEDTDFNKYIEIVISEGLEKMLRDIIPPEHEWDTIRAAFEEDNEFMSTLIRNILIRGAQIDDEEKKLMKEKMSAYIQ